MEGSDDEWESLEPFVLPAVPTHAPRTSRPSSSCQDDDNDEDEELLASWLVLSEDDGEGYPGVLAEQYEDWARRAQITWAWLAEALGLGADAAVRGLDMALDYARVHRRAARLRERFRAENMRSWALVGREGAPHRPTPPGPSFMDRSLDFGGGSGGGSLSGAANALASGKGCLPLGCD